MVYQKLGAGIYRITGQKTRIIEKRDPGEEITDFSKQEIEKREILGVILPYRDEKHPSENFWIALGRDGCAALVKSKNVYDINIILKKLSPEGTGITIQGQSSEFIVDMLLSEHFYLNKITDNKKSPVEMVDLIGQAAKQALENKKQMYKNIASSRPGIIGVLRGTLKPPGSTA